MSDAPLGWLALLGSGVLLGLTLLQVLDGMGLFPPDHSFPWPEMLSR